MVCLWLLIFFVLVCGDRFPFPPVQQAVVISSPEALISFFSHPTVKGNENKRLWVFIMTPSLSLDSYIVLYLGYLFELFDTAEKPPVFVVYEYLNKLINSHTPHHNHTEEPTKSNNIPNDDSLFLTEYQLLEQKLAQASLCLSLLPSTSVFTVLQHGVLSIDLRILHKASEITQRKPVVLHLNHEKPWRAGDMEDMDYISGDLRDIYASYPLVFRNYYYEHLENNSVYVPLGAPFYRYILGVNASSLPSGWYKDILLALTQLAHTPPSRRPIACLFRGRGGHGYEDTGVCGGGVCENTHTTQRQEIVAWGEKNNCEIYITHHNSSGVGGGVGGGEGGGVRIEDMKEMYDEYIIQMHHVRYVVCPLGNSPETFRLHEALEVGAIPLLLRSVDPTRDFLSTWLWRDYPGPSFFSLEEAASFMHSTSLQDADELSNRLQLWHHNFKEATKRLIHQSLRRVWPEVVSEPTTHQVVSEPTTHQVVSEPTTHQVVSESTTHQVVSESTTHQVVSESTTHQPSTRRIPIHHDASDEEFSPDFSLSVTVIRGEDVEVVEVQEAMGILFDYT